MKLPFFHRVKKRLHDMLRSEEDPSEDKFIDKLIPTGSISMRNSMKNMEGTTTAQKMEDLYNLVSQLTQSIRDLVVQNDANESKIKLYQNEDIGLMLERWKKLERDFRHPRTGIFDVSKIPDLYDSIKYDAQHNAQLQIPVMDELYETSKQIADLVIPQEYGITKEEKLNISHGYCVPLLRKILADLQANIENPDEPGNRLNPLFSKGVLSPGRHVRTRLYFTSESHIHSLLTLLRYGGLCDPNDEQWDRALDYISRVSELNYMTQIVIMLYEDPTKEADSDERFHIELHFSPGAKSHKDDDKFPAGGGFRPASKPNSRDVS